MKYFYVFLISCSVLFTAHHSMLYAANNAENDSASTSIVLLANNGFGKELVLASDSKPHAYIVIADEASSRTQRAAGDLQKTIQESTEAVLPIIREGDWVKGPRILVGPGKTVQSLGVVSPSGKGFRDEKIIIRRVGTDLVIIGNDAGSSGGVDAELFGGSQDAVICFLNNVIGAYYYYASPLGKVVPKINRLAIDKLDISESPVFPIREIAMYGRANQEQDDRMVEWLRWNHFGGVAVDTQHSHMLIAPPNDYFKEHPEYYSEVRGERSVDRGWQLCTTNPDVIKLAVKYCRWFLDTNPAYNGAPLSYNDSETMCTCSQCRKLDMPDPVSGGARRIVTFANAVARELAKTHPGKYVAFYAYFSTLEPPMDMKLEKNVIAVIADSKGCVFHSYNDLQCGLARDSKLRLDRWNRLAPNIEIYDYYGLFGDYLGLPFCNINRTIINNSYFRTINGLGFLYDAKFVPGPQGLHYWAAMRSLWDANLTEDSARKLFCDGLYGDASKAMQDYYSHLESFCRGAEIHSARVTWRVPGPLYIWTDKAFSTLNADLQKAMALVPAGSLQAQRINQQQVVIDFTKVYVDLKRVQISYRSKATEARKKEYHKLRLKYLEKVKELTIAGLLNLEKRVVHEVCAPEDIEPHKVTVKLKKTPQAPSVDPLCFADLAWDNYGYYIHNFKDDGDALAYPKTKAHLVCDDNSLYVRVNAVEHHMDQLKANEEKTDGDIWKDDCIRFSIAVPAKEKNQNRFDFYVNANGIFKDVKNGRVAWNGNWNVKVGRSDVLGSRQWAVRMELPWSTLGLVEAPSEFKANLFRHITTFKTTPISSWVSTFANMEDIDRYATITIAD